MNTVHLNLQSSAWYFLICLLVGVGYAYFLYSKKSPWSRPFNWLLALLRTITVTALCFLLLGITINNLNNEIEKPIFIIGVDNSISMKFAEESPLIDSTVDFLENRLSEKGYDVKVESIDGSDSISLSSTSTNFSKFTNSIKKQYKKQNLSDVLLISDGIANAGISPGYIVTSTKMHAIGFGDTTQRKDVLIADVKYNKVVYHKNKFPIEVNIDLVGYDNKTIELDLFKNDTLVESKSLQSGKGNSYLTTTFYQEAKILGTDKYRINATKLDGEVTFENNHRELFIKVVESKEKVLLFANAPHPDLKHFRRVLDKNENIEVDIVVSSLGGKISSEKYSMAIMYEYVQPDIVNRLRKQETPIVFVVTPSTNLSHFNAVNNCIQLPLTRSVDQITPSFVQSYDRFKLNDQLSIFREAPPLQVPFGKYSLQSGAEVIAYQAVSGIETQKELIVLNSTSKQKEAVLIGDGYWQWGLFEYQYHESHEVFDEFFGKLFSYLSVKQDKRKFKAELVNNQVYANEQLVFEVEIFNDLFENVYEQNIQFIIESDSIKKEYEFVNGKSVNTFRTDKLPAGKYRYTAKTQLGENDYLVTGEVIIRDLKLEESNLVADFRGLRELAKNNKGEFFKSNETQKIESFIRNLQPQNKIRSNQKETGVHYFWWLFVLLVALISTEWILRKYHGEY